jgi:uridine kinase
MIKSERIAKQINKQLEVWGKNKAKLVVAIDGYAGSGKTTISDFIAKQNFDVLVVHLDDFIHHWKDRKGIMDTAKDKSQVFEHNWYRYEDLEKLIKAFKTKNKGPIKFKTYDFDKNNFGPKKSFDLSKKILIVDGIFLFHPKHKISKLWDKQIYLDADFTKADKHRIIREKKKFGKSYISETHPDNWFKHYKEAYLRYIENHNPKGNSDLVIKV